MTGVALSPECLRLRTGLQRERAVMAGEGGEGVEGGGVEAESQGSQERGRRIGHPGKQEKGDEDEGKPSSLVTLQLKCAGT